MSYFLCLAVPHEVADKVRSAFDSRIHQMDATDLPIGMTTRGKNLTWTATLLQVGSSSASLIGKGATKRTLSTDRTALLISGVQAMLENEDCESVSLLAHWFRGYITEEPVPVHGEIILDISTLMEMFSESKKRVYDEWKEDARYRVFRHISMDHYDKPA